MSAVPRARSGRSAAFLLATGLVLAACTSTTSSSPSDQPRLSPSEPASISTSVPASPDADRTISVAVPQPGNMVAAFGSLWVQSRADASLWKLDPTGQVIAKIAHAASSSHDKRFGSVSSGLDTGFGSVWSLTDDSLARIDPGSDRVIDTVPIPSPFALAVGEGAVWIAYGPGAVRLVKLDPATMRPEAFASLGTSASALGVGDGSVWWGRSSEAGGMYRIDPVTAQVTNLQVGYNDRFILPTPGWVWLIDSGEAQRLDPQSGSAVERRPKKKADQSIGVSYSHGTIWINDGAAVGFDATSGHVTMSLAGFDHVTWWSRGGIAQLRQRVWLADPNGNRVLGLALT